ncbi:MAG: hypothetical protein GY749_20425 [Desulfobacteraceae bacterium]|nr:hypothetical protein [Desulfobacteraceae bacterium]
MKNNVQNSLWDIGIRFNKRKYQGQYQNGNLIINSKGINNRIFVKIKYKHKSNAKTQKTSKKELSASFQKRCPGCTKLFLKRSAKLALSVSEFRPDTDKASFELLSNPDIVSETEHLAVKGRLNRLQSIELPANIVESYSKKQGGYYVTRNPKSSPSQFIISSKTASPSAHASSLQL